MICNSHTFDVMLAQKLHNLLIDRVTLADIRLFREPFLHDGQFVLFQEDTDRDFGGAFIIRSIIRDGCQRVAAEASACFLLNPVATFIMIAHSVPD